MTRVILDLFPAILPRCGVSGIHGDHGDAAAFEAVFIGLIVAACISLGVGVLCGTLLIVRRRSVGSLFVGIPLANFSAFIVYLLVRPYSKGFWAQFQGQGLKWIAFCMVALSFFTLIVTVLMLLVMLLVRALSDRKSPAQPVAQAQNANAGGGQ